MVVVVVVVVVVVYLSIFLPICKLENEAILRDFLTLCLTTSKNEAILRDILNF